VAELDVNQQLSELLIAHGIQVTRDREFIYSDLPLSTKFKARAVYTNMDDVISSQLDVMAITENGFRIIESVGDFGIDIEEAVLNNFRNFAASSLHPLLAALGSNDKDLAEHVTFEDWKINGQNYTAYIGNLSQKQSSENPAGTIPPAEFFNAIGSKITSLELSNEMHWFRGFYSQYEGTINSKEFLIDNNNAPDTDEVFSSVPLIQGVKYLSSRCFIILVKQ
jgi:hypothetical protein